jgi:predicted ATPase
LLIVEDLHWIDPTTLEYLNTLVDAIQSEPILAVFTCRPDFQSP